MLGSNESNDILTGQYDLERARNSTIINNIRVSQQLLVCFQLIGLHYILIEHVIMLTEYNYVYVGVILVMKNIYVTLESALNDPACSAVPPVMMNCNDKKALL